MSSTSDDTPKTQPSAGAEPKPVQQENRRRLTWALLATAAFMVAELVGGFLANSLALLSDAGHMVSDVAALATSLIAFRISRRPATQRRTFGYRRSEILAAALNAAMLLILAGLILYEAWQRFREPPQVIGGLMLVISVLGLLANLFSFWILRGGDRTNLNLRGALAHVTGDLLGSIGAIVASLLILSRGWMLADPVISAVIALLILYSAWGLLRESAGILLEGTPPGLDYAEVSRIIGETPGVASVHDLHIWAITSDYPTLTCHLRLLEEAEPNATLRLVQRQLQDHFDIQHTTLQVELPGGPEADVVPVHELTENPRR